MSPLDEIYVCSSEPNCQILSNFLLGIDLDPEDGSNIFLRKVG
jgi:hypothetical protein